MRKRPQLDLSQSVEAIQEEWIKRLEKTEEYLQETKAHNTLNRKMRNNWDDLKLGQKGEVLQMMFEFIKKNNEEGEEDD